MKQAEIRWIDIGLNLFSRSFPEPERVLADAAQAGVYCILTGSDGRENALVNAFVSDNDAVGTAGIHPHHADRASDGDLEAILRFVRENPRSVAVGECGLDYDRMFSTEENQLACLRRHLDIAEDTGKPLFLHEREAEEAFLAVFQERPALCQRAVVHCFRGGRAFLERCLEMGFMIGITGWICDDRRAAALREAVKALPLDRVMLETDAPYLTPRNVKGLARTNVPGNIRYVAETLAETMGVEPQTLERCARENTRRFFRLDGIIEDGT